MRAYFVTLCLFLWCYALSFTTIYQDLNLKPCEITIVKHFIGGSPAGDRSYSVGRNRKHATAAPEDYQTHWRLSEKGVQNVHNTWNFLSSNIKII